MIKEVICLECDEPLEFSDCIGGSENTTDLVCWCKNNHTGTIKITVYKEGYDWTKDVEKKK